MMRPNVRVPALLLLASSVVACSGGGDESPGASLSFDVTSVKFVGLRGVGIPSRRLNLTASGSGSYYPAIEVSPPGAWDYTWSAYGSGGWVEVRPAMAESPGTMPAGKLNGTVTFLACRDAQCGSIAASATAVLEADIAVVPGAQVALTAYEGLTGSLDLPITPADAGSTVTVSADAAGASTAAVPWLSVDRSVPAVVGTTASAAGLAPGSYAAELHVTRAGMSGTLDVPVTFDVRPGTVPPAPASLLVDSATTPAALSGALAVGFQPGLAPPWTASADRAWLQLTPPAAPGDGALAYTLDVAALGALPNWASSTATITIQPQGMAPVTSTFTVRKELPEITFARTPLVAGRATDVRVFGRGLSQLASAAELAIDGVASVAGTIDSDREARLANVSLAAGRHVVSARNAVGISTRTAPVDAYAPNALPAGTVDHVGVVRSVAFDLVHGQILVAKLGTLVRLRLVDGGWQLEEVAIPNLADVVATPDGDTVYAATGTGTWDHAPLHLLDPSTLAVRASYSTTGTISSISDLGGRNPPALTADGRLWLPGGTSRGAVYFDPTTGTFIEHRPSPTEYLDFSDPSFAASADGSRLLALSQSVVAPGGVYSDIRPWSYTPAADRFVHEDAAPQTYSAALSADGARAQASHRVYDTATWTLLGESRIADPFVGVAEALSPDGRRAYRAVHVLTPDENNGAVLRIDVFDADAVVAGTAELVKLGEIPVGVQLSSCVVSSEGAWDCAGDTILSVSPLGDAVLLGGTRKLMVVPLPPALSGVGGP